MTPIPRITDEAVEVIRRAMARAASSSVPASSQDAFRALEAALRLIPNPPGQNGLHRRLESRRERYGRITSDTDPTPEMEADPEYQQYRDDHYEYMQERAAGGHE